MPTVDSTSPLAVKQEMPAAERDILKLLLEDQAEMMGFVFSYVTVGDFTNPDAKKIVEFLLSRFDERGTGAVTELVGEIEDPAMKSVVTDLVMTKYELSRRWEGSEQDFEQADPAQVARDAIVAMKKRVLQGQIDENQRALKEASLRGADVQMLLKRHQALERQKAEVETGAMFKAT